MENEENVETNDYSITLYLELDGDHHRAQVDFEDGQPVNVDVSANTHPAMLRLAQMLVHNGAGQSFREGNARQTGMLQGVGGSAILSPSYRVKGPNPLY